MRTRLLLFLATAVVAAAQTSIITTFAGGGLPNGAATAWGVNRPYKMAVDASGNLYIAATYANQVWVVNSSGTISQIIGSGFEGYSGDGGPASSATLNEPQGVAVDSAGNIYISDTYNNRIRKVSNGIITTIAGDGSDNDSGDGGNAINAEGASPTAMTTDSSGNVYFMDNYYIYGEYCEGYNGQSYYYYYCDLYQPHVRKISTSGGISYIVGGFEQSAAGLTVDSSGNLYIADTNRCYIRKYSGSTLTTVAGTGTCSYSGDGSAATSAGLSFPWDVAVDSSGNLYIADSNNNRIREVSVSTGKISTIAGSGTYGYSGDGGTATLAEVAVPYGVTVDSSGHVYIADTVNNRIRKVSAGTISTFAGNGTPEAGGDGGSPTSAALNYPFAATMDSSGNVYIADTDNCQVDKVSGGILTVLAGNGTCGYSGDNGPATSAELYYPYGLAVFNGSLYIADWENSRVRKVLNGTITTVAGNGTYGSTGDGLSATSAELENPFGVAVDSSGNLYIADVEACKVRKVTVSTGIITTIAGNSCAYGGDGGAATSAGINQPSGIAVDSSGNVYIADRAENRIRKVTASTGIITTVAGNGTWGVSGDGLAATSAELGSPEAVAVDSAGNIYIADFSNYRIRKVTVSTGIINTIAGNGTSGFSGDGGAATSGEMQYPYSVAVDSTGNVYIGDAYNNRIREVVLQSSQTIGFGTLSNRAFGAASFTVSATATSGLTVSFASTTSSICTVATGTTTVTISAVGTCTIQATQAGNASWAAATPVNQSFQVTQASPTVTATGNTCVYNGTACAGSGTATGVLTPADNLTPVTLSYSGTGSTTYGPSATAPTNAGTYTVTASFAGNTDYAPAISTPATLTIVQATPTVTATGNTCAYNGSACAGIGTATGVLTPADNLTPVTLSYVGTGSTAYGPSATAPINSGAYTVTASFAGNSNYTSASSTPIALTITQATPTVTAAGNTCVYGGVGCAGSGTATGVLTPADNLTPVTLSYVGTGSTTYGPSATVPTVPGTYTVTASFAGNANYKSASSTPATLTIAQATPTVTATGNTCVYNGSACAGSGTATGVLTPADNLTPVTLSYVGTGSTSYGPSANAPVIVGTYTITASFAGNANYKSASSVAVALTITQATPTVTATGNACVYNGVACTGSGTATGVLTPADNLTPVTLSYVGTGSTSYGPSANAPVNVGTYTMTASFAGNANYKSASSVAVALNITLATPTVTATGNACVYNGVACTGSGTATGVLTPADNLTPVTLSYAGTGTTTYGPSAAAPISAGTYSVTASFAGNANYRNSSSPAVALTITQATPAITWSAPAEITYGSALGSAQLNATASVPGVFTYNPPAGTVLPVGNGEILSVSFTPTNTTDYTSAGTSAPITVNPAAQPSSPANLVITKVMTRTGGSVVVQLTIANTGGTAATNVIVTSVKIGSDTAAPLPANIGAIAAGSSATVSVTVPDSVGVSGAASSLTLSGSYTGGTFSSSSRITLP